MMKRIFISGLIMLFLASNCFADTVERHTVYTTGSTVTATNLNGNFNNIVNEVNGGLDNVNADTTAGYRFYEVLSSTPAAGTAGRLVYNTADNELLRDTGTAFSAFANWADSHIYVGVFTRDSAAASGTQSVTGVGFKPVAIKFLMNGSTTDEASWGLDDGSTACVIYANDGNVDETYNRSSVLSIHDTEATGDYCTALIASFDTNGFTLTWTKTGSPTGTLHIAYMAFR